MLSSSIWADWSDSKLDTISRLFFTLWCISFSNNSFSAFLLAIKLLFLLLFLKVINPKIIKPIKRIKNPKPNHWTICCWWICLSWSSIRASFFSVSYCVSIFAIAASLSIDAALFLLSKAFFWNSSAFDKFPSFS
jgi:hypothetical protein